jgi:hypothetical protein
MESVLLLPSHTDSDLRYCTEEIMQDVDEFLYASEQYSIIPFFVFVLDKSKLKYWSSLKAYWKRFNLLRSRRIGSDLPSALKLNVVDDVYALLEHHWADNTYVYEDERQRLQTDALILIASYTGSRPGALVYVPSNEKISPARSSRSGRVSRNAARQKMEWYCIPIRRIMVE